MGKADDVFERVGPVYKGVAGDVDWHAAWDGGV